MFQPVPSQLIDKYLKGECSVEEERVVIEWYNTFNNLSDPIATLSVEQQEELKNKMLDKIKSKAFITQVFDSEVRPALFRKYYYAAASIAAALLIVFALFNLNSSDDTRVLHAGVKKGFSKVVVFTNTLSRTYKHILPDGSMIWLQPNATIKYNKNFVSNTREVMLTGEAFFDVKKNPQRPFLIFSGGVTTKVLGTSFYVRSSDVRTEVSVMTGKVSVYTSSNAENQQSVYLLPRQRASFVPKGNKLIKYAKDQVMPELNIWEKNTLSFDNTAVVDVIKILNAEFKTNIVLTDQTIGRYALKADFTDVNLPTILELLCKSLDIKYTMQESVIVISK